MDPISNVDRLVLLLRQRLQQRSKAASAGASSARAARGDTPAMALDGLQAPSSPLGVRIM